MSNRVEVTVPDIGDFAEVEIIEILVAAGDEIAAEDAIMTLESDKATMEIPAPGGGIVKELKVSVGDKVSEGTAVLVMETAGETAGDAAAATPEPEPHAPEPKAEPEPAKAAAPETKPEAKPETKLETKETTTAAVATPDPAVNGKIPHASPGVRRFSRELGADLSQIQGTGVKGRILKEDVKLWVKQQLSSPAANSDRAQGGMGIPKPPEIDFSQFGEIEVVPMSRIKRLSGPHLHSAWLNIPHVTHHEEADITELEAFRKSLKKEGEQQGIRVTLLAFVAKVLADALKKFPTFNASLAADGESFIMKHYYNIGIAVDTPQGLVVPVIKEIDKKSVFDIAGDLGEISERARLGKLKADDLKGGCMSISSLGGIGGIGFTPIVNSPEVAILGLTRARMQPVWDGNAFQPRLMMPLDISYDHRAIDGAEAARFAAYLVKALGDIRRVLL